ncbi:hypothetical protein LV469_07060 [Peptoniphilus sp. GNH]|nr:hypothetical protein HMPREF3189_00766 [Clostridiales bacterium KA00134]UHR02398.1 hypothetical protein LV469_07060 [Peptoniphilus sp. GNH]
MKFLISARSGKKLFYANCSPKTCVCYGATTNCSVKGLDKSVGSCKGLMACRPDKKGFGATIK